MIAEDETYYPITVKIDFNDKVQKINLIYNIHDKAVNA